MRCSMPWFDGLGSLVSSGMPAPCATDLVGCEGVLTIQTPSGPPCVCLDILSHEYSSESSSLQHPPTVVTWAKGSFSWKPGSWARWQLVRSMVSTSWDASGDLRFDGFFRCSWCLYRGIGTFPVTDPMPLIPRAASLSSCNPALATVSTAVVQLLHCRIPMGRM